MNNPETAIFLHIPKTAGTTLYKLLWRHYRKDRMYTIDHVGQTLDSFRQLSAGQKQRLQLVAGHIDYGIHEFLPQPATYFTFLRQPVDLVVSYYNYLKGAIEHPHYPFVVGGGMSLRQLLDSGMDENMHNLQTRVLAGKGHKGASYVCTAVDLELAKERLRHHFSVVGLTEQFDGSLLLLKKRFGWRSLYYARLNVARQRPLVDEETVRAIEQANQHDLALYAYGQTLFAEQVAAYGGSFDADLARFQRRNAQLSPLFYLYWHAERQPKLAYRRGKLRWQDFYGRVRARLQK